MDNLTFTTRVIGNLEWQVDLPEPMPWAHAVEYARMMDKAWGGGWRLPDVHEMAAQYDYVADKPANDMWEPELYWTSSAYPRNETLARAFHFKFGEIGFAFMDGDQRVRLVRTIKEQNP